MVDDAQSLELFGIARPRATRSVSQQMTSLLVNGSLGEKREMAFVFHSVHSLSEEAAVC